MLRAFIVSCLNRKPQANQEVRKHSMVVLLSRTMDRFPKTDPGHALRHRLGFSSVRKDLLPGSGVKSGAGVVGEIFKGRSPSGPNMPTRARSQRRCGPGQLCRGFGPTAAIPRVSRACLQFHHAVVLHMAARPGKVKTHWC